MENLKHLEPKKLIFIGASTGGPSQLTKIVNSLKPSFNATIIIAQHMGDEFIPSFISRLNHESILPVSLAVHSSTLENRHVYICSKLTKVLSTNHQLHFQVDDNEYENYNPNINYLFSSSLNLSSALDIMGIILTGIGDDGANGLVDISRKGGLCLAENEESSVVYGMPARAKDLVKDVKMLVLDEIIKAIKAFGEL